MAPVPLCRLLPISWTLVHLRRWRAGFCRATTEKSSHLSLESPRPLLGAWHRYNHSTEQSISMHGAGNEPANVPLASEGNGVIKWIRKEHSGNCFSPLQRSWGTRGSASLH